jgi:hypothetical protein
MATQPTETKDEIKPSLFNALLLVLKDRDTKAANPIFMALIAVGLFVKIAMGKIFSTDDGTIGPANAVLWGYGIVAFSILGIILLNIDTTSNDWNSIKKLPWALVGTIILLMWIISLNLKYYTTINKGTAPEQYYTWSTYSSILLIGLVVISIFQYILSSSNSNKFSDAKQYSTQLSVYAYMLAFLNLVGVTIMQVILDCFTVDG